MSKKILIVSSSPRRGGNTDSLCDEFLRGAQEAGHDVEKVALREKKIGFCLGCGKCFADGTPCWQPDAAPEIAEKMIAADVIVLATPVYFYAMSGQLKTLIDRLCGRYLRLSNKTFYFLAAGAEGNEGLDKLNHVFDNLMGFLDCLENPTVAGKVLATGVYEVGAIAGHPALRKAYEMGRSV